jgi:L-cystine uptake protein TcyP (sodium:dicarboxylate symporter family)
LTMDETLISWETFKEIYRPIFTLIVVYFVMNIIFRTSLSFSKRIVIGIKTAINILFLAFMVFFNFKTKSIEWWHFPSEITLTQMFLIPILSFDIVLGIFDFFDKK